MMPLYLFTCPVCGNSFEELRSYYDPPPHCPCGALAVRQMGNPSVIFKGTGFHATDYGKHKRRSGS